MSFKKAVKAKPNARDTGTYLLMRIMRMSIDIAKLRKLIEDAVEEGAGINEGYRAHGASYDVYEKAVKEVVEDTTNEIVALLEKDETNDNLQS